MTELIVGGAVAQTPMIRPRMARKSILIGVLRSMVGSRKKRFGIMGKILKSLGRSQSRRAWGRAGIRIYMLVNCHVKFLTVTVTNSRWVLWTFDHMCN